MNNLELDAFDWKLLKALQSNARLSNVALSEQVNLSPSQCSRRLQRLEQSSLIESYNTQLNISELGYQITAFISVTLEKGNNLARQSFQEHVTNIDTVLECYAVSGSCDYWLRVISHNLAALSDFITEELSCLDGIRDVSSTIVLNQIKQRSHVPLPN
ncbi:Lrp/AsnC family transcriptional regulator [Marinomonas fungiae]|uniref:DNA-binding transcriptional regulator, Lrp family n=1 Tax=Marinomonas fungiae TaxID=1137284 RepID=A0A0K6IQ81_9GAMM|nr:Lrp/AsnC family transcriptional regulator [Marinomonas fungiae]CUB05248.1 DNA-binding transcriptional regulator, Lrp family [Marinomonas fungiae]